MSATRQTDHATKMVNAAVQTDTTELLHCLPRQINGRRCLSLTDFSDHISPSPVCRDGVEFGAVDVMSGSMTGACSHVLRGFVDDFRNQLEQLARQVETREAELQRLQQERKQLRERLCESRARNREMTSVMNDLQLCLNDLQGKYNDDMMMANLKQAEHVSVVYSLKTKLHKLSKEAYCMLAEFGQNTDSTAVTAMYRITDC